jgi:lipid II isoglutaminyl synthase (glutamine-hydrolysing)
VLRIVTVYPDLLGTYGDRGNGLVLERRAALRGIDVELCEVPSDAALPRADLYCVGGGEDGPQQLAVARLEGDGTLRAAIDDGAVVLAVCAGIQILGRSFPGADGQRCDGVGVLGVDTVGGEPRAVGEVVVEAPEPLGTLTGFENHAGRTVRDEGVAGLGRVVAGVGNGDGTDGARDGRILATYLHGPVLARNPKLADLLLGLALGDGALAELPAGPAESLHDERLGAVRRRRRRGLSPA